ncbi:MAG: binding-protein-dependent transport system, secreted component [Thermoleophilia bacterium]|nr:binding-protein-dependent transport system, secreted component [Thermoleophilia bacterium]
MVLLASMMAIAGCGGDDTAPVAKRVVQLQAPATLVADDALTFCSDIGYPPMEFDDGGRPAGADIEIGQRLAKLMDVSAAFVNTPFDDVLTDLDDGACDAVISSLTNTAERRELVHFVNYLEVGQSLMVETSNPSDIEGLDDLGGKRVAVQAGTTNEEFLRGHAKDVDGTPPVITPFAKDTDATAALKTGRVDAYFGDSPVVAYHIGQEALTYAFAGDAINSEPIGIAVRHDDTKLRAELQRGIEAMYDDGSMDRILRRWKLDDFAIAG